MSTSDTAGTDDGRRRGRGRLSSIEMLPEEADADLAWVNQELREGNRPQVAILAEFNARLADRGIGGISKGAFSRYSVRRAREWREYDERLRLSKALCESMGPDGADRMTIALSERIKMAADALLAEGNLSAKEINALANANRSAVTAQRHAAELRRQLEKEFAARLAKAATAAEAIAREGGLSAERVAQLRREVLGVRS